MIFEKGLDYVGGDLSGEQEAEFEELLFSGTVDARELAWIDALTGDVRALGARGTLSVFVSLEQLAAIASSGILLLDVDAGRGGDFFIDVQHEFEIIVTRFHLNVAGVRRVELEEYDQNGELMRAHSDVPFDAGGLVALACERELIEAMIARGQMSGRLRFIAIDDHGQRRVLAEFVGRPLP